MIARTVTIQRHYPVEPAVVWRMWTTAESLESWWGPDGFTVEVHALDVRPGGTMRYSMHAVNDEVVAFLRAQGLATTTTHEVRFVEVVPHRLLTYHHPVDFVPGVEPYEIGIRLELRPDAGGTRLRLVLDAMHDQTWTDRAVAGWGQELDRLTRALEESR
jgi:uncharacterized protein YndB with AHSA1/START domain